MGGCSPRWSPCYLLCLNKWSPRWSPVHYIFTYNNLAGKLSKFATSAWVCKNSITWNACRMGASLRGSSSNIRNTTWSLQPFRGGDCCCVCSRCWWCCWCDCCCLWVLNSIVLVCTGTGETDKIKCDRQLQTFLQQYCVVMQNIVKFHFASKCSCSVYFLLE